MPCSTYEGKQRKACYASEGWTKPLDKEKSDSTSELEWPDANMSLSDYKESVIDKIWALSSEGFSDDLQYKIERELEEEYYFYKQNDAPLPDVEKVAKATIRIHNIKTDSKKTKGDMAQPNIDMMITYLEVKLNRDLNLREAMQVENDLLHNYDEFEEPSDDIAKILIDKYNLKSAKGDGFTKEEAIALVKEKEAEGYESNLYDDGHFDGFADAVNVLRDLLKYLDGTNVNKYIRFIEDLKDDKQVEYNLNAVIRRLELHAGIKWYETKPLTESEYKADGTDSNDSKDILTERIRRLFSAIGEQLRLNSLDSFDYILDVQQFFMDLISKDARIPTKHQEWRLMNLAKVLTDIPEEVLIRHYESIMEDQPLKDR